MPTPEGKIEDYLLKKCKENKILCWKFVSPSQNGVPDRILIYNKKVIFVEVKAPGETPRPDQLAVHKIMKQYGAQVFVCDTEQTINELITTLTAKRTRKKASP